MGFQCQYAVIRFHRHGALAPLTRTINSGSLACSDSETCGAGLFFCLLAEKSPDTKWYLPPQAPTNTSFCTRIFPPKGEQPFFASARGRVNEQAKLR